MSDFIPKEDVKDPHDLVLWYSVNGEERQRGTTGMMLERIEDLIVFVSGIFTLQEGDVILTGACSHLIHMTIATLLNTSTRRNSRGRLASRARRQDRGRVGAGRRGPCQDSTRDRGEVDGVRVQGVSCKKVAFWATLEASFAAGRVQASARVQEN